jgi:hypothetical protein
MDDIEKFQLYASHLPNIDAVKANAYHDFEKIKYYLTKAVTMNELRPGLMHRSNRLQTFINEYGFYFTKADHIGLIKLYLGLINTTDLDLTLISICLSVLVDLLKLDFLIHYI